MIQSGIHFGPILRQNQFELQNRDGSAGFGSPSFFCFTRSLVTLRANPSQYYIFKSVKTGSVVLTGWIVSGEKKSHASEQLHLLQ